MNRDAILATLIGLGLGLVITGIIVLGPTMTKNLPKFSLPNILISKPTGPTPTPTPAFTGLTIDSPLPDSIATDTNIVVSGKTAAGSTVVVQGPTDEDVVEASQGAYAAKISLVEGKNEITVTSYSDTKIQTQTLSVFYFQ